MGALDDAIREHLELKRKHGGDPAEVERLEAEAFGPSRREPPSLAPEAPPDEEPALAPDAEIFEPELEADLEPVPELEPVPPPVAEEPTELYEPPPAPRGDTPPQGVPAVEPEPEPDPADADADHDVLEETPDFLQDAPEHDRLWFEQRPPRDFDFDG